ncbi:clan AA aspartic protease [Komarekiella sp. 'clone 1']|uniref:Clan AA aspartic protease n=1 Tax=Komarekiella delphini-convector SJRDD-AB1 TaxID=2593771 RepID=A0AA40VTY1_9NOST|nr:clan AA aspartic protease [Komarekiella delphini-convector]MBD6619635.1 clan AA aspartic protease [Komarekiella delphini-convector SJRDD-AB1]
MIVGSVNADYEPIIILGIYGANAKVHEQTATVDKGFNGWLFLPPDFIAALKLLWKRRGRAILGDGSECVFDVYEAIVVWDEQLLTIPIDEAESDPLVGMSLMEGYRLTVEVIEGGLVKIEKL